MTTSTITTSEISTGLANGTMRVPAAMKALRVLAKAIGATVPKCSTVAEALTATDALCAAIEAADYADPMGGETPPAPPAPKARRSRKAKAEPVAPISRGEDDAIGQWVDAQIADAVEHGYSAGPVRAPKRGSRKSRMIAADDRRRAKKAAEVQPEPVTAPEPAPAPEAQPEAAPAAKAKRSRKPKAAAPEAAPEAQPEPVHATVTEWSEEQAERAEMAERKRARVAKLAAGEPVAPVAQPDPRMVKALLRATSDQRIALAGELGVKVLGKTREQSAKTIARALVGQESLVPVWLERLVNGAPVRAQKAPTTKRAKQGVTGLVAEVLADLLAGPAGVKVLAEKHATTETKIRGAIDALRARFTKAAVLSQGGGVFVGNAEILAAVATSAAA